MKKMLVYSSQIEILLVMCIHLHKFEKKKITNKIFVEFQNSSHSLEFAIDLHNYCDIYVNS